MINYMQKNLLCFYALFYVWCTREVKRNRQGKKSGTLHLCKWLEGEGKGLFWGVVEIGDGNLHKNYTGWEELQYDNIIKLLLYFWQ